MAKLALSIAEARDQILKRLGGDGSTEWEGIVEQIFNRSMVTVSSLHDWDFLRKYAQLTVTAGMVSASTIDLPADLDRLLSISLSSSDITLKKLQPQEFVIEKKAEWVDEPTYYTFKGYASASSGAETYPTIEIYTFPGESTVLDLWYCYTLDEIPYTNEDDLPKMPNHIWDLVVRHAELEALKMAEAPVSKIKIAMAEINQYADLYKRRESKGDVTYGEIMQRGDVTYHYHSRGLR